MWEAHHVPFSLGFEGEYWKDELPGLLVPIPGTDAHVLAVRYSGKSKVSGGDYAMAYANEWYECGDLLMLACMVKNFMEDYHAKQEQGQVVGQ